MNTEPYQSPGSGMAGLIRPREASKPSKSLYVSHFLSTWNSRGFEFGAVLFLATIYPGTLLPMSIYALVRAAAAIVFSPWIGRFIDSTDRLQVVRISIVGQRVPVVLSCAGFLLLLSDFGRSFTVLSHATFAGLVVLACLEKISSVMNLVAVERDWVVVIADAQEEVLAEMNSQMRRIDLFCKLLSPLAIALLDGISSRAAVLVTLAVNASVAGLEYYLIARVHRATPALKHQRSASVSFEPISNPHNSPDTELTEHTTSSSQLVPRLSSNESDGTAKMRDHKKSSSFVQAARGYITSPAFLPSLCLSMLYLTVLSFSGQMTTFLLSVSSPKMTSATVGLLRTASTVFELSSTFIAPRLITSIGPIRAGIWCLSWQIVCLTIGVTLLWTATDPTTPPDKSVFTLSLPQGTSSATSIMLFIATVILSRVGLWSFDLVAQLQIQASIDLSHRGTFSSVEAALQNFFELCTFVSTIVWSKPEQFRFPAATSLAAIYLSAMFYAKFVRDKRGHLLHLPACLEILKTGSASYTAVSTTDAEIPSHEVR